jgi:hypothetical protein
MSTSKKKSKRKRTSSSASSTSSKATVKIGQGTGIVLASFPSGPPAPGTLVDGKGKGELAKWCLYGETTGKVNTAEALVGTTARMQWQAVSGTGVAGHGLKAAKKRRKSNGRGTGNKAKGAMVPGDDNGGSCYLVGIYDPDTNEVTMHYAGNKIHPLEQKIRKERPSGPKSKAFADFSYREQREELTVGFGSQRSIAGLRRMKKNILTQDNVGSKDYLMAQVSQRSSSSSSSSSNNNHHSSRANAQAEEDHKRTMLPSYNKETEEPVEIFPFDQILPVNQLLSLRDVVKKFDKKIAKPEENADVTDAWEPQTGYVKFLVQDLVEKFPSKTERRTMITKMLFLDCLLKFNKSGNRFRLDEEHPDMASVAEKYKLPDVIFTYLLSLFTTKTTKREPGSKIVTYEYSKTDKKQKSLVMWILIMALHVESFNMKSIFYMARELKQSTKELLEYFRYFGCTYEVAKKTPSKKKGSPKRKGQDYNVKLKAPLAFPKPKFAGRGR